MGLKQILINVTNILMIEEKKEAKKMDVDNLRQDGTGHREKEGDDL